MFSVEPASSYTFKESSTLSASSESCVLFLTLPPSHFSFGKINLLVLQLIFKMEIINTPFRKH